MKKRNLFLVGVLSLSILMTGCGGEKTSSSTTGGSTPTAAEETIKIGWYGPLTGPAAADGTDSRNGAQLAVDQFNRVGGLDGKKVELITEDDQGKPEEALKAVQKLMNRDKVVAIVDGAYSGSSKTVAPKVQAGQVPMVVSIATHPDVTKGGEFVSRVVYTGPVQGKAMANYAVNDLQKKNIAGLYVEADYGKSVFGAFKEEVEKLGGKIAMERTFRFGDKDFSSLLTAVKAANPDALYVVGYYNEAASIANQMKELGIDVPLLGVDGFDSPKFLELTRKNSEGAIFSTSFYKEDQRPIVQDFVREWTNKYKSDPSMVSSQGYDAAMVILEGLRKAGTDKEKLAKAIHEIKDLEGTSGKISFGPDHEVIKPIIFMTVKDGKFQFVTSK